MVIVQCYHFNLIMRLLKRNTVLKQVAGQGFKSKARCTFLLVAAPWHEVKTQPYAAILPGCRQTQWGPIRRVMRGSYGGSKPFVGVILLSRESAPATSWKAFLSLFFFHRLVNCRLTVRKVKS